MPNVADKYALDVTENLGKGCNSWPCSSGHVNIFNIKLHLSLNNWSPNDPSKDLSTQNWIHFEERILCTSLYNFSLESQIVEQFSDNFWKTKEQGIDGICEVTYQINELPKYMIRDRPELIPNPELCPAGQKYFEVIKTKNTENCERRAAFYFTKPGRYMANTAFTR